MGALLKTTFFLCCFIAITASYCQDVDSLVHVTNDEQMPDSNRIDAYYMLARVHVFQNADTAMYFVGQALEMAEAKQNLNGLGEGYGWMGYLCAEKGNIKEAIDYNLKSLYIAKQQNLRFDYPVILNNLATLNMDLGNHNLALSYYEQCVALNLEFDKKKSLGANYNNIGLAYRNINELDSSLYYYQKAISIRNILKDERGLAATYSNMGSLYEVMDSNQLAMDYYLQSLALREKNGIKRGAAMSGSKIGNLYFEKGEVNNALQYASKAHEIAANWSYRYEEKESAKVLYKIYKEKGNYPKALHYFEIYADLHDSIHSIENQEAIIQSKFQFEYNNKYLIDSLEKEKVVIINKLLKEENKVKESRLSVQGLWLTISGLSILLLVVSLYLIRRNAAERMEKLRAEIRYRLTETIALKNELSASKVLNKENEHEPVDLNIVLHDKLTTREQEILDALMLGLSNKEIGEKLFLSVNTIKTHILSLYVKLDVNNRTQAAVKGSLLKIQNKIS